MSSKGSRGMGTFPENHPIEHLRGRSIPDPEKIREELAVRIQWLTHTLSLQKIRKQRPGRELPELKALVMVRATFDQAYPVETPAAPTTETQLPKSDTDPPPAGGFIDGASGT